MKYVNKIIINGATFTHTVIADSYKEALKINKKRKEEALLKGRKIIGRLEKEMIY
jgi:3-dehydroquinate dehydratase